MRHSHIAIIGAPLDLGAGRRGVDMGPSAVRVANLNGRLAELGYVVARTGRDPSALPDIFYIRVGATLGGRLPGHKILLSLLHARHPSGAQKPNAALKAEGVSPADPASRARALSRPTASTGKPF